LVFSFSEQEIVTETDLAGNGGEGRFTHDCCTESREVALGRIRAGLHQMFAYDETEDGVAEELHPFIVIGDPVLVRIGFVGERTFEELCVLEGIPDPLLDV
jgi:hypothetical protein